MSVREREGASPSQVFQMTPPNASELKKPRPDMYMGHSLTLIIASLSAGTVNIELGVRKKYVMGSMLRYNG